MEFPKSAWERLQGNFLLLNALIERDHLSLSKKGEKKSRGCSPSHAVEPWPGPIESIKINESGSQKSKRALYRTNLCKIESPRKPEAWAGCKIESPWTETYASFKLRARQWAASHEVFEILANLNLSDKFKGPTLGPHHIVQGTVADIFILPCYREAI